MDKELKELSEQISKLTNEIAEDFEMKYRDFIPDFLVLADCQDKIKQSISYGNKQLKLLEDQISSGETLDNAKNDCPNAKKDIIQDFLNRLSILSEIEKCLTALSLLPNDIMALDLLSNVRMVLRLEDLAKALDSEATDNLEAVNERILPLLFTEIQTRKGEISQQLDEFFNSFLKFKDNDRVHSSN